MRLGKILAQSRITVPEISGEALGMIRVALRSKGQNMTGFGKRASFHHCLVPATLWHPGLRALGAQVSPVGVLKVDRAGWKFPPSGLARGELEPGRQIQDRGDRWGTAAHRSV